jgi:hypothetical protein
MYNQTHQLSVSPTIPSASTNTFKHYKCQQKHLHHQHLQPTAAHLQLLAGLQPPALHLPQLSLLTRPVDLVLLILS